MTNQPLQAAATLEQLEALKLLEAETAAARQRKDDSTPTDGTTPIVQESLDAMFSAAADRASSGGANQLSVTAQLTKHALGLVNYIQQVLAEDMPKYKSDVEASMKNHAAMDDIIGDIVNLGAEDVEYLKSETEEELEKALRSQQSKRSRAKSKVMDKENYTTMMTGAVSELLIRLAMGKLKNYGGGAAMGDLGFSDEDLEKLAEDTEELKKAIRNVQSKKSIMSHKQGFDDKSERWLQLLRDEATLKDLRDRGSKAVDEKLLKDAQAKKEAEEVLNAIDTENIGTVEEALTYFNQLKEILATL